MSIDRASEKTCFSTLKLKAFKELSLQKYFENDKKLVINID